MVELSLLALLSLDLRGHCELYGNLKCSQASVAQATEGLTSMLSNHANSVYGGLSDSGELRAGVFADLLTDLGEHGSKEIWSEELHHVVENEEQELGLVLVIFLHVLREYLGHQKLND